MARTRIQFEQFCSPELARALERNPALLESQERTVTVMFCDIRGYSRMAERLGTRRSYDLLADVMDLLTDQIIEHNGIVVDFAGDGVLAMWNAPEDQAGHPAQAAGAALAIQRELPSIYENWKNDFERPVEVGIGINTGEAQIGNAGSRKRMKYGPRGNTINMASRVEGVTRLFGVPILITESTRSALPEGFSSRRIRRVRVKNIDTPVMLFELRDEDADEDWTALRKSYEDALSALEADDLNQAAPILRELICDARFQDADFNSKYERTITAWEQEDFAIAQKTIQNLLQDEGFHGEATILLLAQHTLQGQCGQSKGLFPVLDLDTK
ncbi:MAG: adenylate/guanylate cyclase domain-containing protein [Planctomycetes bacterium]|nr:adenylate/guanylate cyclase domain-containing protein [Planctomycetota bacterium]